MSIEQRVRKIERKIQEIIDVLNAETLLWNIIEPLEGVKEFTLADKERSQK